VLPYISQFEELLPILADTAGLEERLAQAQNEYDDILRDMRRFVDENTRKVQDQREYGAHFRDMGVQCSNASSRVGKIKDEILEQSARKERIRIFLDELRQADGLVTDFDEGLWSATVEYARVSADKTLTFVFRDGTEIPVAVSETTSAD
jgi:hypothetical protein